MGTELRYPKITGASEKEQLRQMQSYLHQLVDQLQYALGNVGASSASVTVVSRTQSAAAPQKPSSSADPVATFDSIKALIIKSADIVDAYYDEISNRLEGVYVAESDFGTYMESTSQEIIQNSSNIEQLFTNEQGIISDIESLEYSYADVNAHIRSGHLFNDENGVPVYGLEIGQRTEVDGEEVFDKFARFTSDRLSFYDSGGAEVAYISDYKLFIRNVEITNSYKIGGFVDTVTASGDIITKWEGVR